MDTAWTRRRLLGEILLERGVLTVAELEEALAEQRESGRRLGEILIARGLLSGPTLTRALAEQCGFEVTTERGFGTGLWAAIERRHPKAARPAEPAGETPREGPRLEAVQNRMPNGPPPAGYDGGDGDLAARVAGCETRLALLERQLEEAVAGRQTGADDLIPLCTVAALLGLDAARAGRLTRRADFPPPASFAGRKRLWLKEDVVAYGRAGGRAGAAPAPSGRPKRG